MIYATAEPAQITAIQKTSGRDKVRGIVVQALTNLAVAARDREAGRIVVTSGETTGAVTQALGVSRLDVGHEIALDVEWEG